MYEEKFYVFDIVNNTYKTFNNYYNLLCFVNQAPYGAFGNNIKNKRWQQKRRSIWALLSSKLEPNPIIFENVLFIAYDVYMNVLDCKKLDKDVIEKEVFMPKYKYNKGWRYYSLYKDSNYLGFRNGPIPHTGKRGGYNYYRDVKTTQERRMNCAHLEYTRGKRRNLPSSWEDIGRSDMMNKYSWKKQKKVRQWM